MNDIQTEKLLEAIHEKIMMAAPPECRDDCPLLKIHEHVIIQFKEKNNFQISEELGLTTIDLPECPAKGVRRCR